MTMEKLLIVDDDDEIRAQLKWGLGKEYAVLPARDCGEAQALFTKARPRVVTLDLGLPPCEGGADEGFRCLEWIHSQAPHTKIIVITGNDERASALRAVKSGAYDFYQKPVNLDELKVIIRRAFHLSVLEEENRALHQAVAGRTAPFGGMIGQCPDMQAVFALARKVASADVSVLIEGESGTGKELVARAIHASSLRAAGPFVPINCGAIPENLLESELFGHERGAFTGAHAQVQGKFEYAHDGTLFLDEIGELPLQLQVKLLRFLQDKSIQRIGGREDISVNTRVIAATNRDLAKLIAESGFREDLYYRIGVVQIKIPPLRARRGDIVVLASYFLNRLSALYGKRVRGFNAAALDRLECYDWPGNVRELENKIQRAVILAEGALIDSRDLGFAQPESALPVQDSGSGGLRAAKDKVERSMTVSAIERNRGNMARAAEDLGISRPTLYDIMKKHGLYSEFCQTADKSPVPGN